jgi:xanthine dehydrogenase accessory factor
VESADHEVLRAACAWRAAGEPVTLVTVARTWGSAPRPVGSIVAIRGDGRLVGSISGGCLEAELAQRIRAHRGAQRRTGIERLGLGREEALRLGLPCGGRVEMVLEAVQGADDLGLVLEALEARRRVSRRLVLATGEVSLHGVDREQGVFYDGVVLEKVFGPAWRLLIIGAGQVSRHVAEMALSLEYHVMVCDPRERYAAGWDVAGVELDRGMPDDAVRVWAHDARSAVVALTHDPRLDDLALMEALSSEASYVGALGSRANNARRRERLVSLLGLPEGAVARLHGPVGLPIGSRTPAEIAVAILAELTATRHGRCLQPLAKGEQGAAPLRTGRYL